MYKSIVKPCFDLLVGLLLLIISIPVFAFVALFYQWKKESPILFVQKRVGKDNRKFNLYKLRTLDADTGSPFPLGKFLRKYYLDELPQVWNVIRGEMSFIGPRPLLEEYMPLYDQEQMTRHQIKPGITGWAQVNGGNNISWQEKFELDLYYLNHMSFIFDLRILHKTLKHWFFHKEQTIHYQKRFTGNQ